MVGWWKDGMQNTVRLDDRKMRGMSSERPAEGKLLWYGKKGPWEQCRCVWPDQGTEFCICSLNNTLDVEHLVRALKPLIRTDETEYTGILLDNDASFVPSIDGLPSFDSVPSIDCIKQNYTASFMLNRLLFGQTSGRSSSQARIENAKPSPPTIPINACPDNITSTSLQGYSTSSVAVADGLLPTTSSPATLSTSLTTTLESRTFTSRKYNSLSA